MTKKEYQEYVERVVRFIESENIEVHSETGSSGFMKSPCECCGNHDAGNRETIKAGPCGGPFFEYDICMDCVYFLEYGQLNDSTMMEIEG